MGCEWYTPIRVLAFFAIPDEDPPGNQVTTRAQKLQLLSHGRCRFAQMLTPRSIPGEFVTPRILRPRPFLLHSSNKAILDVIFNIYGALLLAFAIGGYIVLKNAPRLCRFAMGIFIGIQILSFSWGFFPVDPIGAESTFAGTMHNVFGGVVALASIVMPLLMGLGLRRSDDFHGYAIYSLISSVTIFVSGLSGVILAGQGFHVFGFFERITIGTYKVWIFVTALNMLRLMQMEDLKENILSTQPA
jgi:hypothetical protein